MGMMKLLHLRFILMMVVMEVLRQCVESTVVLRFDTTPPARSRSSTASFRYSVLNSDGSYACQKQHQNCSVHCELDGQTLRFCPLGSVILKSLTVNRNHRFFINVTTPNGETNSSSYKWFIDTIPPTASIATERSYTNAEKIDVSITFSEPCAREGGFRCINASLCDVTVDGPGLVDPYTVHVIEPDIKYSLTVALSREVVYSRVTIMMAENLCMDQAGNRFTRTNSSVIVVYIDRRPVLVDLWTSVPSYELKFNKVPRTVLATNKKEDLEICLEFSDHIMNSTTEIMSALHANVGNFVHVHSKTHGNRRFVFELRDVYKIDIITIKLQSATIIGRSGTRVSDTTPLVFMYDSTKPGVKISTSSPKVTKESTIDVIVTFTKPVFGFQTSAFEIGGGRITRFEEITKSLYSLQVLGESDNVISVFIPEGKVNDVAGNTNSASNGIEVRQYSAPAISVALHSFVTAGILATSLAAAVLSISSASLGALGALSSGTTDLVVSDPAMNLLGMVGHLQVFVFSDWISVSLPIEYSETTKGLQWLVPRGNLPWEKENMAKYKSPEGRGKLSLKPKNFSIGLLYGNAAEHAKELNSNSSHLQNLPSQIEQQNRTMSLTFGQPLESYEYSTYFLREEPLLALVKKENYTGWMDFKMNVFWLGVVGGGLIIIHVLIVLFLRWRTGSSVLGRLSVLRFELFLLILMIPCISQSSAFVIRGGTTRGIVAGTVLLTIPSTLIISVFLFLVMAIFVGDRVQYKEIKNRNMHEPWHTKPLSIFFGKPTKGRWFYQDGLASSLLLSCGLLFEDRKGPPVFVLANESDPSRVSKWTDSGQNGIGRMRAVQFNDGNEETHISMSKKLLGCARSAYLILDILRRVALGIISGIFSPRRQSQCIIACALTFAQLVYISSLKPYIKRGVHVVESVSLLCEAAIFGLSLTIADKNPFKEQIVGFIMLLLLLICFIAQLVNEWYTLVRWLIRLPQSSNPSFKLGVKSVAMGLILPCLPRKYWLKLLPGFSQPSTGLVHVLPLSPETESIRRNPTLQQSEAIGSMTATVVPLISPDSHSFQQSGQTSDAQQGEIALSSRNDLRKLREMAKASFSGSSKVGGSSS